jgi:hypothetical protein
VKFPACDFVIVMSVAMPVPLRLTLWGLNPSGETAMVSVPVRVPVAVGLKMTLTVQLDPAVMVAPLVQVLVPSWKSPLIVGVPEIVIDPAVPFVSVTACRELEVLINCPAAKIRGFGVALTTGFAPAPDTLTTIVPLAP